MIYIKGSALLPRMRSARTIRFLFASVCVSVAVVGVSWVRARNLAAYCWRCCLSCFSRIFVALCMWFPFMKEYNIINSKFRHLGS
jgi:cellobiose-specific phosphotransferase system component IIC